MKFASPPAGSSIELAEASESRVVMVIPPGGKRARSLGCFAVIWLAITVPVGVIFLWATVNPNVEWEGDGRPPLWGIILFFSVFWSVGFGMGYAALKMKFEKLMLCLEPDRLIIQRTFFGRKKLSTIQLQKSSRASLQESYSENDVPVYRLEIDGVSKTEKFGTALSLVEKQWLAQTINRFLGHEDSAGGGSRSGGDQFCRECGSQLLISDDGAVCLDCGAVFNDDEEYDDSTGRSQKNLVQAPADVAPEDVSAASGLVVEENSGEQLIVSFLLNPSLPLRIVVGGICTAFSFGWMGVTGSMVYLALTEPQPGGGFIAIFVGVCFFIGFGPLIIGMAVAFGRARVAVDQQWLSVRYHIGPLGFTRKVATDTVQDVLLGENSFVKTEIAGVRRSPLAIRMVRVETTGKPLILTLGSKEPISRNLCGVVRYQLHRLGFRLVSD